MEDLQRVRNLINSGERKQAWDLLNQALASNPRNENAWILAYELAKPDVRESIAQKALTYLPNSSKLNALIRKSNTEASGKPQGYQSLSQRLASRGYKPQPQPYIYDLQSQHVNYTDYSQDIKQTTIRNGVGYQRARSARNWAIVALLLCPFCPDVWQAVIFGLFSALIIILNTSEIKAYEANMGLGVGAEVTEQPAYATTSLRSNLECPNCHSQHVQISEESFNLGKSILWGVLIGPVGFLSGFLGKNPLVALCEICGTRWRV